MSNSAKRKARRRNSARAFRSCRNSGLAGMHSRTLLCEQLEDRRMLAISAAVDALNEPYTWGDQEYAQLSVVTNTGSGGYYDITLGVSANRTFNSADDHTIGTWSSQWIPSGSSWSNHLDFQLPSNPSSWDSSLNTNPLYFYLIANGSGGFDYDFDEVTVNFSLPDATATIDALNEPYTWGHQEYAELEVTNAGTGAYYDITLGVSANNTFNESQDHTIDTWSHQWIPSGGSWYNHHDFQLPTVPSQWDSSLATSPLRFYLIAEAPGDIDWDYDSVAMEYDLPNATVSIDALNEPYTWGHQEYAELEVTNSGGGAYYDITLGVSADTTFNESEDYTIDTWTNQWIPTGGSWYNHHDFQLPTDPSSWDASLETSPLNYYLIAEAPGDSTWNYESVTMESPSPNAIVLVDALNTPYRWGEQEYMQLDVTNSGDGAFYDLTLGVSANATFNQSSDYTIATWNDQWIAPGTPWTNHFDFQLPSDPDMWDPSLDTGSLYFYLIAESPWDLEFSSELVDVNAYKDAQFIGSPSVPSGLHERGDDVSMSVIVENTGSGNESYWVGLSLSNPTSGNGWYDVPPQQTPVIAAGSSTQITFDFPIPAWLPPEDYTAHFAVWEDYDRRNHVMLPLNTPYDRDSVASFTLSGASFDGGGLYEQLLAMVQDMRWSQDVDQFVWELYNAGTNDGGTKPLLTISGSLDLSDPFSFGFTNIGPGADFTILIDLADFFGVTPEGQENDTVTTWIDTGLSFNFSVGLPITLGLVEHQFETPLTADDRADVVPGGVTAPLFVVESHIEWSARDPGWIPNVSWNLGFGTAGLNYHGAAQGLLSYEWDRSAFVNTFVTAFGGVAAAPLSVADQVTALLEGLNSVPFRSFTLSDGNWAPDQPGTVSPVGEAFIPDGAINLQATPFQDRDNDQFLLSEWQVWDDFGYSNTFVGTRADTLIDHGILAPGRTYHWQVRYQDNRPGDPKWSPWSDTASFFLEGDSPPIAYIDGISPNPAQPPTNTISLDGHAMDYDGDVVAWEWRSDLDGILGVSEDIVISSNEQTVGTHQISYRVQDNDGLWSDPVTGTMTILNAVPTAELQGVPVSPVAAGSLLTLTLGGYDNDENGLGVTSGRLRLDGSVIDTPLPGAYPLTAPSTSGSHTISYEVMDDEGTWSSPVSGAFTVEATAATVADRHIFYNNSAFDTAGDDMASAFSKEALLPGQTATFANYTSYNRGINGIMVDVSDVLGPPALSDFEFRVGNDNNPSGWLPAPAPTMNVVLDGGGVGVERIVLTWADNEIENTWLEVTVLSDANGGGMGLAQDEVFYFGNAIGETGNDGGDARVNPQDIVLTRNNQTGFGSAAIDNAYDIDRDGRVNPQDVILVRNNQSGFTPLQLIEPPSVTAPAASAAVASALGPPQSARETAGLSVDAEESDRVSFFLRRETTAPPPPVALETLAAQWSHSTQSAVDEAIALLEQYRVVARDTRCAFGLPRADRGFVSGIEESLDDLARSLAHEFRHEWHEFSQDEAETIYATGRRGRGSE